MLVDPRLPLRIHGEMLLESQGAGDGDLGFIGIGTALAIGGGLIASLLGGGFLWTKHEEHELDQEYYKWLEIYQNPPYNLSPLEAARLAKGEPSPEGFNFGFNMPTVILGVGSILALYVGSQVLISWLTPGKK